METESRILEIAASVISRSSRTKPADSVMRAELQARKTLTSSERTKVSKAVFAYYRWFGWLEQHIPIERQIVHALELAEQFSRHKQKFSDSELIRRAVPDWVKEEFEMTSEWAVAIQEEPKLWLRARMGQGSVLSAKLNGCKVLSPDALADTVEYTGQEDLFTTPEYHAGDFEIQDLSSQIVGIICAPQPGEVWWDACAGEGGKTMHLSDLMGNKGLIWATDRSSERLRRLKRRAARGRVFNFRSREWDGGGRLPTKTKFDGVLVDGPCSGIGTWQRNPHARWTLTPGDVVELAEVQLRLVSHAAAAVKPGGRLVYAVCTLTRKETREVVEKFERSFQEFEPFPFSNPLSRIERPAHVVFLLPQRCEGNGMFISMWKRRAI